jgi:mediator of RNA polymerase II transcription subunit 31
MDQSAPHSLSDNERLLIELEFVQNLANAKYLNYLAQQGYLEEESFLSFLRYLQYWKKPEYMQLLVFPQCLAFLDSILNDKNFRRELAVPQFVDYVHQQQGAQWMINEQIDEEVNEMNP